jgi:glutathione S-transferase
MTEDLVLVSHDLCPYVQRAAIALAEKGAPFRRVDIDLADKPDWFRAMSPLDKTPLLHAGDAVLFESAVIVEYLEDTRGPALHPADPLERARHRAWIEVSSAALADVWTLETTADEAAFTAACDALRGKLARVEAALGEGPWFAGPAFGHVDAAFAPLFRYFDTFDTVCDLGVFEELPKVRAWRAALARRPSVRGAVAEDYDARLRRFLSDRPGSIMSRRLRAAAEGVAIGA